MAGCCVILQHGDFWRDSSDATVQYVGHRGSESVNISAYQNLSFPQFSSKPAICTVQTSRSVEKHVKMHCTKMKMQHLLIGKFSL